MNTLHQIAWALHVQHWEFTHEDSHSPRSRHLLLALQYCYGDAVTQLIERGDKLPPSAWSTYQ